MNLVMEFSDFSRQSIKNHLEDIESVT
jgi:hypothetical protein